jgi:hypothetical protein
VLLEADTNNDQETITGCKVVAKTSKADTIIVPAGGQRQQHHLGDSSLPKSCNWLAAAADHEKLPAAIA